MLGSVSLLSWNGNLAYKTILGTPAEVCYFGSNVTNLEECVKVCRTQNYLLERKKKWQLG